MNSNNILFSFIIPVYNVEQYINQCVDSILSQEYKNFEIILVDDGSKDNSARICDEYAKKDERVHVIHKENGGLSDARNCGLKKAVGEYVLFVDSDDFIFENSLTEIARVCENKKFDVVFLKGYKFYSEDNTTIELDQDIFFDNLEKSEEILKYLSYLRKFPGSACTKAFRKKFIIQNELFFLKGLLSEDIEWMIRVFKYMKTASSINVPYYYYRQNRKDSITNTITSKNINSLLKTLSIHGNKTIEDKTDEYINCFLAYEYIIILAQYLSLDKTERMQIEVDVYNYSWILKYNNNLKVKMANIFKNIFGIKFTACLLHIFLKYKEKKR